MSELVAGAAQDELLILPKGKVRLHGIDFDEDFLSELVARHFRRQQWQTKPMFSDAYGIHMRENPSAHRRKFKTVALQAYALFVAQFGDMPLNELRHVHITEFRDSQLARGLHANSVRRHINMLNAMVNMAFKHLDMDRLSPFRRLYIRGIPHLWVRKKQPDRPQNPNLAAHMAVERCPPSAWNGVRHCVECVARLVLWLCELNNGLYYTCTGVWRRGRQAIKSFWGEWRNEVAGWGLVGE